MAVHAAMHSHAILAASVSSFAVLKSAYRVGANLEIVEQLPQFPKKLKEAKPRQGFVEESQYRLFCGNAKEFWLRTFLALCFT